MAEPGRVLVLGATSAMAQACARLWAGRGASLLLVGRNPDRLEAVAADLRVRGAARVETLAADLAPLEGQGALLDQAWARLGAPDVVLLAQGLLADSDACEASAELTARVLQLDFTATALLAQEAALRLARRGAGTVVAISSVAGDRGRQSNYAYGAAKGGLSLFLEGLRNRMFRQGVRILTVKPGFVDSPMTAHLRRNALFASPETVGRAVVRAVDRGRDRIYVPGFWLPVMLVVRHVPGWIWKRLRL
ncbi:MAG: SDR family oxidoreductase [Deltaproteobacteria bacterium]|nr:SDR family oxidoreductase [Deltaproteobacteria bacterium]